MVHFVRNTKRTDGIILQENSSNKKVDAFNSIRVYNVPTFILFTIISLKF